MDEGEIDFSDNEVFLSCNSLPDISSSGFFDDLLKNTHTCTHTHTCNLPGPDQEHTHTCFHTHTQLFTAAEEEDSVDKSQEPTAPAGKKRPLGNREAVRKYREKKKAHTAYLEEQVAHLRRLNQQLMRKIQSQATLEAEVIRLRSLLSEFRGRIDGELGAFGRPSSCVGITGEAERGACSLPPDDFRAPIASHCSLDVPCLRPLSAGDGNEKNGPCHAMDGDYACNKVNEKCRTLKPGHAKRNSRGSASGKASGSTVAD